MKTERLADGHDQLGLASAAKAIDAEAVSVTFGGVRALTDVSTSVNACDIVAIIGPNGAGKTTLLNAICGLVPMASGRVAHLGKDISKAHPTRIARGGVGRSFQDPMLIDSATVLENVLCGAHTTIGYSLGDQVFRRVKVRNRERAATNEAVELLELVGLQDLAEVETRELAYGPRKMVDIVRATMARPSVLLLDEPSSGIDHQERDRVEKMLLLIHERYSLPMLLVEHHMDLVRAVSNKVVGLASGTVAMEGATEDVLSSGDFRAMLAGDLSVPERTGAAAHG